MMMNVLGSNNILIPFSPINVYIGGRLACN